MKIALTSGLNFPSLELNGERLSPVTSPFVGVQIRNRLSQSYFIKTSFLTGQKKSVVENGVHLKQRTMEIQAQMQKKFDDFYFSLGLVADFDQGRIIESTKFHKKVYSLEQNLGNGTVICFNLGTEFRINKSLNFLFNYNLPIVNRAGNTQFGVLYTIFGKESKHNKVISHRQKRRHASKRQINELHNGTLLFRLKTLQPKINAMKKAGLEEKALIVEEKQRQLNLDLMSAFKKEYSFSKIQFFFSHNSNKVRNGEFENIFLNNNLVVDSTIIVEKDENIYTVGFQSLIRDTIKIYDHNTYGEGRLSRPLFYGSPDFSFTALVVMNQQFQQLDSPFPYYTREFGPVFKRGRTTRVLLAPFLIKKDNDFDSSAREFNQKMNNYFNEFDFD
jgi:hypothetical protein